MSRDLSTFELTEDHLTLLRAAYTSWDDCEYGAPSIDPKRPYGNSDVAQDIAVKLGWVEDYNAWCDLEELDDGYAAMEALEERAAAIHEELQTALQIVLYTGEFKVGKYVAKYPTSREWTTAV